VVVLSQNAGRAALDRQHHVRRRSCGQAADVHRMEPACVKFRAVVVVALFATVTVNTPGE
jgi:hypothetical protein